MCLHESVTLQDSYNLQIVLHVDINVCLSGDKFDRQCWICGHSCCTLVVVLAPHEDAAPVGQIIRNNWQSVPPGLHHSLHIVKAGVAAQVSRLKPCIDLGRFLQLNNLLCRLGVDGIRKKSQLFISYTQDRDYLYSPLTTLALFKLLW